MLRPLFRTCCAATVCSVGLLLCAACGPENPTGPEDPGDGGGDVIPLTVTFVGDSVGTGTLRSRAYECPVAFDALVSGGPEDASVSWQRAAITFEDPATGAVLSRSGWNADFVTRFFGLNRTLVPSPSELEGGPLVFGASSGEPYVLSLLFSYVPSDTGEETGVEWRFQCR